MHHSIDRPSIYDDNDDIFFKESQRRRRVADPLPTTVCDPTSLLDAILGYSEHDDTSQSLEKMLAVLASTIPEFPKPQSPIEELDNTTSLLSSTLETSLVSSRVDRPSKRVREQETKTMTPSSSGTFATESPSTSLGSSSSITGSSPSSSSVSPPTPITVSPEPAVSTAKKQRRSRVTVSNATVPQQQQITVDESI